MKKTGILNSRLEYGIARLGHTQRVVICDAGMPLPFDADVIDLALVPGVPSFSQVLEAVASELQVESYFIASETEDVNPEIRKEIDRLLPGLPCQVVDHEELKKITMQSQLFIRTGECTSYANVILVCGVTF